MLQRNTALVRHNIRLLLSDPAPLIVYIIMPLIMMAFLQPSSRAILASQGYTSANGAEQIVPGMAVFFAFLNLSSVGTAFFREHGWGTWERLRASQARPFDIIIGKCLPSLGLIAVQLTVLFLTGWLLFGLEVRGSLVALVVVALALTFCLLSIAVAWIAICRTFDQFMVFSNLVGVVFAGLGGALAPTDSLPNWAQAVAPISPAYWALKGFKIIILDGGGLTECATSLLVLLGFGAVALVIALSRFRFAETKVADT